MSSHFRNGVTNSPNAGTDSGGFEGGQRLIDRSVISRSEINQSVLKKVVFFFLLGENSVECITTSTGEEVYYGKK